MSDTKPECTDCAELAGLLRRAMEMYDDARTERDDMRAALGAIRDSDETDLGAFAHYAVQTACDAISAARRDAASPAGDGPRPGVLQTGKGERKMSEYLSTTEACAIAAHEANRVYCATLNDNSQTAWNDAPQWQRDSAINGAKAVLTGSGGPRESHESWLAEKEATGWVYGEVKDPSATPPTHPCMVAYDALPPEQKAKDALFVSVVKAMATACGRVP